MESTGMAGVEIREMRERIRQLGGTLEVNSNGRGTLIRSPIADWQNRVDSYGMTDN
jgi:signal transduction histidine kinase